MFQNQSHKILLMRALHLLHQGDGGGGGVLDELSVDTEFRRHAILEVDSIAALALVSVSS